MKSAIFSFSTLTEWVKENYGAWLYTHSTCPSVLIVMSFIDELVSRVLIISALVMMTQRIPIDHHIHERNDNQELRWTRFLVIQAVCLVGKMMMDISNQKFVRKRPFRDTSSIFHWTKCFFLNKMLFPHFIYFHKFIWNMTRWRFKRLAIQRRNHQEKKNITNNRLSVTFLNNRSQFLTTGRYI